MTDLFLGRTRSYGFKFISAGTAHTFTFPFQMDKVTFFNYTKYGTSDTFVQSTWFRGFPAGDALQQGVGTAPAAKIALEVTNGFTTADTSGGASAYRALISGVTKANPCVVTTVAAHNLQSNQIVRITDLGIGMPTARGMDQINNKRFKVAVLTSTTFSLKDPVTGDDIDSTDYTTWVAGGRVTLETRVLTLNNPEVGTYTDTPFTYDSITYKLTAGTAVMGADNDQYYVDCFAYGSYENLGDLLT